MVLPLRKAKTFVYVSLLGAIAFCTFYWYSSSSGKHHWTSFMDGLNDYWRWECNKTANLCRRVIWKYGDPGQSLRTCQMTCGVLPLWPQPNGELTLSNTSVTIDHTNIKLSPIHAFNIDLRRYLQSMVQIFLKDIRSNMNVNTVTLQSNVKFLYISVTCFSNKSDIDFELGMDESYILTVQTTKRIVHVRVKSGTYFGARHALETLRQLIWYDEVGGCLRIISQAKIVDSPSFPYRGLLLDTANHYISVPAIKRTIDAMAAVKMNVFHWHIIGSTSFPFTSKNMEHTIYGAFSSKHVYTKIDVISVTRYAKLRGIKVLIELDSSGNMGPGWNWGHRKGYGDLNVCYKDNIGSCKGVNYCSQLNPNNNMTYKLLQDLLFELVDMTGKSDIIHLGGNIDFQCWSNSPEITKMDIYKRKGVLGLLKYHHNKVYNIIVNTHKEIPNVILWSEYFKKYTEPSKNIDSRVYIAHVNSDSETQDEIFLINKGYKVILSHADKWDLSQIPHWTTVYDHRPWEQFSWSQREQVLGGEGLVWTNLIDDRTLENRVWPAAAAIAEVLWTDPQIESLSSVSLRIQNFREHLVERGLKPAAITPTWCSDNPGACL